MTTRVLSIVAFFWAVAAFGAPEPVALTSGWLSVLDVDDASGVVSDDPAIAFPIIVDARQVLLVGGLPGTTTVRVGERDFLVMVGRAQTFLDTALAVRLRAETRHVLPLTGVRRVAVGTPDICDAVVSGEGQLELRPLNPGLTLVIGWSGGMEAKHRFQLLVMVESNGVTRSAEEFDAALTEPLEGGRVALIAGERYLLQRGAVERFAVKDESVAVASAEGELVVLTARARGATRFVTWDSRGRETSRFVVVHERSRPPKPEWDRPPPDVLRGPNDRR